MGAHIFPWMSDLYEYECTHLEKIRVKSIGYYLYDARILFYRLHLRRLAMQIVRAVVVPVELKLKQPIRMADLGEINSVMAFFIRLETVMGITAWGAGIAHSQLTGESPQHALHACNRCADRAKDLHPTNIEYSLSELEPLSHNSPAARSAFDMAFHDLLGLAADMPLYRLLGGYRSRIQTSVTVPISPVAESVEIACRRSSLGYRMLKIKGGIDPGEDVQRIHAIHRALPNHVLRLDADGGYDVRAALEVAHALKDELEMIEQPTPPDDLTALCEVTRNSPVPILADQSVRGLDTALQLAARQAVNGMSVKIVNCGGVRCARQIDAIARAAKMATMVGCLIEPALSIAAGLHFALSSPNVRYGDLDGNLELERDPTIPSFTLEESWLTASEVPELDCQVDLS
jgi:L-alanine-DL-glutamate epimerase-like enolase superfamily enzyme